MPLPLLPALGAIGSQLAAGAAMTAGAALATPVVEGLFGRDAEGMAQGMAEAGAQDPLQRASEMDVVLDLQYQQMLQRALGRMAMNPGPRKSTLSDDQAIQDFLVSNGIQVGQQMRAQMGPTSVMDMLARMGME